MAGRRARRGAGRATVRYRPQIGWPNATNTGVPVGTTLTTYTGPYTITNTVTVDAKQVNGYISVQGAGNATFTRCLMQNVFTAAGGTVTLIDCEIVGGEEPSPAVGYSNLTIQRCNIHGGQHSVLGAENVLIEDSWLHGQYLPPDSDWHLNAFLSNGGSNGVLRRNTLSCDAQQNAAGGGCTGDVALIGDFSENHDFTLDANLFKANPGAQGNAQAVSYCLYAGGGPSKPFPDTYNIVVTNNVFEHGNNGTCGQYGAITEFQPAKPGNVWSNNRYTDGTIIPGT